MIPCATNPSGTVKEHKPQSMLFLRGGRTTNQFLIVIIMLYADLVQTKENAVEWTSGHVGDKNLTKRLNDNYQLVTAIQVDGDELELACKLLGRELPCRRVYTFIGDNAKELAINWMNPK